MLALPVVAGLQVLVPAPVLPAQETQVQVPAPVLPAQETQVQVKRVRVIRELSLWDTQGETEGAVNKSHI